MSGILNYTNNNNYIFKINKDDNSYLNIQVGDNHKLGLISVYDDLNFSHFYRTYLENLNKKYNLDPNFDLSGCINLEEHSGYVFDSSSCANLEEQSGYNFIFDTTIDNQRYLTPNQKKYLSLEKSIRIEIVKEFKKIVKIAQINSKRMKGHATIKLGTELYKYSLENLIPFEYVFNNSQYKTCINRLAYIADFNIVDFKHQLYKLTVCRKYKNYINWLDNILTIPAKKKYIEDNLFARQFILKFLFRHQIFHLPKYIKRYKWIYDSTPVFYTQKLLYWNNKKHSYLIIGPKYNILQNTEQLLNFYSGEFCQINTASYTIHPTFELFYEKNKHVNHITTNVHKLNEKYNRSSDKEKFIKHHVEIIRKLFREILKEEITSYINTTYIKMELDRKIIPLLNDIQNFNLIDIVFKPNLKKHQELKVKLEQLILKTL